MKPKAFAGFSSACVANFDGNAIQGITAEQVKHMPPDSFNGWSSNIEYMGTACAGWTSQQAGNLTDEHACEALGQDCFAALSSEAYAGFTYSCVANWRDNELGGSVTPKDLAKMSPKAIAGLNDHDMSAFSLQCAGLRYSQVVEFSDLACSAISFDCIQVMSSKACEGFAHAKGSVCQSMASQCSSSSKDKKATKNDAEMSAAIVSPNMLRFEAYGPADTSESVVMIAGLLIGIALALRNGRYVYLNMKYKHFPKN
eukprot:CAMPEP_0184488008 /NCGR_PEP_ID=MMETSP0113_2-20130426/10471_1 /TAXON_ID=91329 /ORGANISM="Norrisiella sphaerica, Strain BC52" /LENGTH=255 /DNA_ID=CAMNT_0026870469 /DNA_START=205 /DNA_END=972 /DNA_ORIENTATION=+